MRYNLIKFRRNMRLSQEEMASKLGISRAYYSRVETGKSEPAIGLAFKIQEAFNVDNVLDLFKKE
jgi:putative transcriptional regulator